MLFFKSYLNICKDLILYWIICESIDFYKESKKNKINIINFLIYDIITDFILSIIIYSIIYFFKISLLQFMIAVVVGVLFVFMLLTKFSEKDILLKGVILTLALFIIVKDRIPDDRPGGTGFKKKFPKNSRRSDVQVIVIIIFYVICSILDDIIMGNISFKDWKSEKKIVIIVLFVSILYGLADFIEDYMGLTFPLTLVMGVAGTIFGIIEAIFL